MDDVVNEGESSSESNNPVQAMNYAVDTQKNLVKIVDEQSIFIQKLKKAVFKMVEYRNAVYFIDTFGDCFVIETTPKFLFGVLSHPCDFEIINDRIYSVDKYSRVWVHSLQGEIINIAFIGEKILKCCFRKDMCVIVTNKEPNTVSYYAKEESSRKERYFFLFNCNFEPYCEPFVEECINKCIKLMADTNLF
ncbi:uncharacterized protein VICG_00815 [Vittaforma corneae ATCC 50505]|uniref:CNH domain-containing protein n=1 Tax=Vittaforma corneae (strain ATCC 50505) TaxID=993615 RepID=L2GPE5_VITCO|nr:uncharacterized protein VICG_00815 [Vittaforma corneae ATCC 50505]ELA42172.1 hypothetical protein VICG_00815 [Vittaforma corneae ATCC 50505]